MSTGVAGDRSTFAGLLIIDGTVVDASQLKTLSPDRIESMEVIKGTAATSRYSDPRAASGVIVVTTKR
jgi:Ca-activated chloride channel family protein